jgi:neutral ceramidase
MTAPIVLLALFASTLTAADYKAGLASLVITPSRPIYLSGYANRTHPSEGVALDIKARALAIEDRRGERVVIVAAELIGLPRAMADIIAARVQKAYDLDRARLLLNVSHTHTGPMVAGNLTNLFDLGPADQQIIQEYTARLTDDLVALVGMAIQNLSPADLWFGNGQAHFGVNRRQRAKAAVQIGVNPQGPTDPDVPILKITSPDGHLRALLFGYACHNTTLTGEFYKITGDYAGYAQAAIEKANPAATAMYLALCGGDQNPNPRGTLELAEQHGKTLADEVMRVAAGKLARVRGPVRAAFQIVDLDFAPHTRSTFETRLEDRTSARVRHARAMLRTYDEGRPIRRYSYPVQAIQFGRDLTILALGGEVVVDYCLRVKKEYGAKGIMAAAYSNDVMSYIPSKRVLQEGGYEADSSMIYYGLPGPYAEDVEDRIFTTIRQVLKRVGRAPAK